MATLPPGRIRWVHGVEEISNTGILAVALAMVAGGIEVIKYLVKRGMQSNAIKSNAEHNAPLIEKINDTLKDMQLSIKHSQTSTNLVAVARKLELLEERVTASIRDSNSRHDAMTNELRKLRNDMRAARRGTSSMRFNEEE